MARKPRPGSGGRVSGPGSMHLGIRLSEQRKLELERLKDAANRKAESVGLPPNQTISSLVVAALLKWIDTEIAKLDAEEKKRRK